MSRTALTLSLLTLPIFLSPVLAQTSAPSASLEPPSYYHPEPSYEAETPILLGTFLEQSGSSAEPTATVTGVSPRPITILTDPARREPAKPRVAPVKTIERGQ